MSEFTSVYFHNIHFQVLSKLKLQNAPIWLGMSLYYLSAYNLRSRERPNDLREGPMTLASFTDFADTSQFWLQLDYNNGHFT